MKTIGYAIVGTGYFGAELGRIMKEEEGARIVAVLEPENGETVKSDISSFFFIVQKFHLPAIFALETITHKKNKQ